MFTAFHRSIQRTFIPAVAFIAIASNTLAQQYGNYNFPSVPTDAPRAGYVAPSGPHYPETKPGGYHLATVEAPVVSVEPHYTNYSIPETRPVCKMKEQPVYQRVYNGQADPQRAIAGALIGGIMGNAVTSKDKKAQPAATAFGALLGAAIASENSKSSRQIVGYERKKVCHNKTIYREVREVDYYDVTYQFQGRYYTTQTSSYPGETITLEVTRGHLVQN